MQYFLQSQVNEKKQKEAKDLENQKEYIKAVREKEQAALRAEEEKLLKIKSDAILNAEFIRS